MDNAKDMLKNFPDEVGFLDEVNKKLNKTLEKQNEAVSYHDKEYREFKKYMVEGAREIDPHEMFQNLRLLDQTDNYGAMAVKERDKTKKILSSPYFARIDFCKNGTLQALKHYIGRFSFLYENEPLILDWRTPAAGMFYDFELGDAEYTAPSGKVAGKLTRKRQFKITDGKLEYVLESSVGIKDEVLQRELSATSNERMKTIISTLQKEQNAVIRNENAHTLIIQGVAGSGKTSVALHRLAYLLYRYKEKITAKNLTIISPNKVFADFISGVLPELGEEPIYGISFYDLAYIQLQGVIRFDPEYDPYEIENTPLAERVKLKASTGFFNLLTDYLSSLDGWLFEPDEYSFGRFKVSADFISKRYSAYNKLPVKKRLALIADDIYGHFNADNLFGDRLPKKSEILSRLKAGLKISDALALYKDFHRKYNLSDKLSIKNKTLEWADVFPFLYCRAFLDGLKQSEVIKHAVIDEMQDYTPLSFAVINILFPCKKTILGDFSQAANPYLTHSLSDLTDIYKDGAELVKLQKSYRSSFEIMSLAKKIGGIEDLEPIERHGKKPDIIRCIDGQEQLEKIKELIHLFLKNGLKTLGIILKTDKAAKELYELLSPLYDVNLISKNSDGFKNGISVSSVQMSKGLEFDEVIIPFADYDNYNGEHGRTLLYVACTRAMHRLTLMYHNSPAAWLPTQ